MDLRRTITRIMAQLAQLGVPVESRQDTHPQSFLPGVWIDRGVLCVCPWAAHPGDVLHEAGHLAVVPSRFRSVIEPGPIDRVEGPFGLAMTAFLLSGEGWLRARTPDDPLIRAMLQSGEEEAIAWAYAAAVALGFPTRDAFVYRYVDVPVARQPYQGNGEEVWSSLQMGTHDGIEGLHRAGLCNAKEYPRMIRWMQE